MVYSEEKSRSYSLLFKDGFDKVYWNDYERKFKFAWYDGKIILDYDDILDIDVNFDEITKNRIVTQYHTITTGSSRTSNALVGGMLFGGAGAVAGFFSGGKEKYNYTTEHTVSEEFITELDIIIFILKNGKKFRYPFVNRDIKKYNNYDNLGSDYANVVNYSYMLYTKAKSIINSKNEK